MRFERCEDVSQAGVLLALPALLACGLLRHSAKYSHLPAGYYTLGNIFLLLGLMILNRVKSVEELRRSAPREWGKILGRDRLAEGKRGRGSANKALVAIAAAEEGEGIGRSGGSRRALHSLKAG